MKLFEHITMFASALSFRRFEHSSYVHTFSIYNTSGIGFPRHREHSFFDEAQ